MLRPLLAPGRIEIASLIAYVASTGASFVTDAAFTTGLNDGRSFKTLNDLITLWLNSLVSWIVSPALV